MDRRRFFVTGLAAVAVAVAGSVVPVPWDGARRGAALGLHAFVRVRPGATIDEVVKAAVLQQGGSVPENRGVLKDRPGFAALKRFLGHDPDERLWRYAVSAGGGLPVYPDEWPNRETVLKSGAVVVENFAGLQVAHIGVKVS